jgi:hypothetical protein
MSRNLPYRYVVQHLSQGFGKTSDWSGWRTSLVLMDSEDPAGIEETDVLLQTFHWVCDMNVLSGVNQMLSFRRYLEKLPRKIRKRVELDANGGVSGVREQLRLIAASLPLAPCCGHDPILRSR